MITCDKKSKTLLLSSTLRKSYSSCFYEGYRLYKKENLDIIFADDPQTKSIAGFGVNFGAEFKFGTDSKYVLKAEYTVDSNVKENSFNMSLTVPFPK